MLIKDISNLFSVLVLGLSVSHIAMKFINLSFEKKIVESDLIEPELNLTRQQEYRNWINADDFTFLWQKGILGVEKKAQEIATQPEIKQEILSPLSSTYRLVGTIIGERSQYALIASKSDNKVIIKRIKEEIEPGAVISAIRNDRIEILRGDVKEILFLFQEDEKKFSESQEQIMTSQLPPQPPIPHEPYGPPPVFSPQTSIAPDLKQIGEDTYEVKREYVQANLQNMADLLVSARAIPYIKDGQIQGFRIVNISPGSFYRVIGIHDGDVIKSINGVSISNPQSLMKILSDIQNETFFEIKIERVGREKTLKYYVR